MAIEQAARQIQQEHTEQQKTFRELTKQELACREDAEKALSAFEEELTASVLTEGRVLRAVHCTIDSEGTPLRNIYLKGGSSLRRPVRPNWRRARAYSSSRPTNWIRINSPT